MIYLFKKISLIFLCSIVCAGLYAQSPLEELNGCFDRGNVTCISRHFDDAVSMTLSGEQAIYSRTQAEMVLRDFFEKNSPREFHMKHTGGEAHTRYVIGVLHTTSGDFRIYYALKQKSNRAILLELRIGD